MSARVHQRNHIRVFLSSTFRDMVHEREYLNKVIFPEIKKQAQTRGVEFTAIDLRWGVTEEEANQGDVVSICLEEIDRCKPFFMGFVGERYGWQPSSQDVSHYQALIERFPVTKSSFEQGLSVTEMEILHGVLESDGGIQASFYQRDLSFTQELSDSSNHSIYFEEDVQAQSKLNNLKERLRHSEYSFHSYAHLQQLGEKVKQDLYALIDRLYPEQMEISELEKIRRKHRYHAEEKAFFYLPNPNVVQILEDFFKQNREQGVHNPALLIAGPSGRGKSALLSHWVNKVRAEHPQQWIIEHYAGVSQKDQAHFILSRIIQEIIEKVAPQQHQSLPNDFDELCEAAEKWFKHVPRDQPLLLVIDGLNQIKGDSYRWIPSVLPPHICCVLSSLPGEIETWLLPRNVSRFEVPALHAEDRRDLTIGYLSRYRKKLSPAQLDKVISSAPCENPLFLITVLAELVIFGSFEQLDNYIDHLLSSKDLTVLFEKILIRFEADYGLNLTQEILSALWASIDGLSEDELIGITKSPLIDISKITLALDLHLKTTSGLVNFSHNFLRETVQKRYLSSNKLQKNRHLELSSWFRENSEGKRRAEQLNLQVQEAQDWSQLYHDLTDQTFGLEALIHLSKQSLFSSWTKVSSEEDRVIEEEYEKVWSQQSNNWQTESVEHALIDLLDYADRVSSLQLNILQKQLNHQRRECVHERSPEYLANLSKVLDELGKFYRVSGQIELALEIYQEVLLIDQEIDQQSNSIHSQTVLSATQLKVGRLLEEQGELDQALAACQIAVTIRKQVVSQSQTAASYEDLGEALRLMGKLFEAKGQLGDALSYCQEAVEIHKKLYLEVGTVSTEQGLGIALNNLGDVFYRLKKNHKALEAYQDSLQIKKKLAEQIGTPLYYKNLTVTLNRLGMFWSDQREYKRAINLYQESMKVARTLVSEIQTPDARKRLCIVLNDLAWIYVCTEELDKALPSYQESVKIARTLVHDLGTPSSLVELSLSLDGVGDILYDQAKYEPALEAYSEALEIRKELSETRAAADDFNAYRLSLLRIGSLHKKTESWSLALSSYAESVEVAQHLVTTFDTPHYHQDLCRSRLRVAAILEKQGQDERALGAYYKGIETFVTMMESYDFPSDYLEKDHEDQSDILEHVDMLWSNILSPQTILFDLLSDLGDDTQIHKFLRRIYDQQKAISDEHHPCLLAIMQALGIIQDKLGREAKAIKLLKKVYQARKSRYGSHSLITLESAYSLSRALYNADHDESAKTLLLDTLNDLYQYRSHPAVFIDFQERLIDILVYLDDEQMEEVVQRGLVHLNTIYEFASEEYCEVWTNLIKALNEVDKTQARTVIEEQEEYWKTKSEASFSLQKVMCKSFSGLLRSIREYEKALIYQLRLLELSTQEYGENHDQTLTIHYALAQLHMAAEDRTQSEHCYRSLLQKLSDAGLAEDELALKVKYHFGQLLYELYPNIVEERMSLFTEVERVRSETLEEWDIDLIKVRAQLGWEALLRQEHDVAENYFSGFTRKDYYVKEAIDDEAEDLEKWEYAWSMLGFHLNLFVMIKKKDKKKKRQKRKQVQTAYKSLSKAIGQSHPRAKLSYQVMMKYLS